VAGNADVAGSAVSGARLRSKSLRPAPALASSAGLSGRTAVVLSISVSGGRFRFAQPHLYRKARRGSRLALIHADRLDLPAFVRRLRRSVANGLVDGQARAVGRILRAAFRGLRRVLHDHADSELIRVGSCGRQAFGSRRRRAFPVRNGIGGSTAASSLLSMDSSGLLSAGALCATVRAGPFTRWLTKPSERSTEANCSPEQPVSDVMRRSPRIRLRPRCRRRWAGIRSWAISDGRPNEIG